MKRIITKVVVSTMLAAGSLGVVAVATVPAGATAAAATNTFSGKVKTVDVAKDTFTLTSGAKTYTVAYKATTKFTKGSAKILKAGLTVSVKGKLVKAVIEASSIAA
ncbi:MAG TPA: hypothetical protein VMV11_06790 [Acidimicrobiales bacterium]|nr:hypothetical protein [Acidimicrobiales bacterium]